MRIFSLFLFIFNSYINAQENLSLKEAFQIALKNNYGIKLSKIDVDISRANNNWSLAGAYPDLSLNINPNVVSNSIDQKFVNNTEIKRNNAVQKSVNVNALLSYNVLNGFKVYVTKDKLNLIESLSANQLEIEILNLYSKLASIYYQILSLQNTLPTLQAQEKIAIERKNLDEKKFTLGQSGKTNFLLSSLDYQEMLIVLERQKQAINEAYNSLHRIMLTDLNEQFTLSDKLDLGTIKKWNLLNYQLDNSIHQKKFQLQQRIQILTQEEIKRQKFPNLNVLVDYHYNRLNNQAGFNLYSQSFGPGMGVQLNVPLFKGFRVNKEIEVNKLESDRIQLEKDQWQSEANYILSSEKSKILHYISLIELEQTKVDWAKEYMNILKEKGVLGESNSIEFSQALYQVIQISSTQNDALFNAKLAEINIQYLIGNLDSILE